MNDFIQAHIESHGGTLTFKQEIVLIDSLIDVFGVDEYEALTAIAIYLNP